METENLKDSFVSFSQKGLEIAQKIDRHIVSLVVRGVSTIKEKYKVTLTRQIGCVALLVAVMFFVTAKAKFLGIWFTVIGVVYLAAGGDGLRKWPNFPGKELAVTLSRLIMLGAFALSFFTTWKVFILFGAGCLLTILLTLEDKDIDIPS